MDAVVNVYAGGGELDRMVQPRNQVEWERTCELLLQRMHPARRLWQTSVRARDGRLRGWPAWATS